MPKCNTYKLARIIEWLSKDISDRGIYRHECEEHNIKEACKVSIELGDDIRRRVNKLKEILKECIK